MRLSLPGTKRLRRLSSPARRDAVASRAACVLPRLPLALTPAAGPARPAFARRSSGHRSSPRAGRRRRRVRRVVVMAVSGPVPSHAGCGGQLRRQLRGVGRARLTSSTAPSAGLRASSKAYAWRAAYTCSRRPAARREQARPGLPRRPRRAPADPRTRVLEQHCRRHQHVSSLLRLLRLLRLLGVAETAIHQRDRSRGPDQPCGADDWSKRPGCLSRYNARPQ